MQRLTSLALGAALLAASTVGANAQQFPSRAVRLLVPWAAGGDTDNVFRPLAPLLQKHIGQPVVITNVPGGYGTTGAREARSAPPDGYTVFAAHDYIHVTYYSGIADVKYSDFEPICLLAATPSVLTASAKTPFTTWAEFIEDAKKRPGQITAGVTPSSTSQVFLAMVEKAAGIKLRHVSYDSVAPRMTAVLGGHIELTDASLTQRSKVEVGQLRFLAIAAEKRSFETPAVPTLQELGIDIVHETVRGLMVPRGTPSDVKATLGDACQKAVVEPAYADAMKKQGGRVAYLNAVEYQALLDKNDAANKAVIAELGLIKK